MAPVALRLACPDAINSCIILTNNKNEIETKPINDIDLRIMNAKEFETQLKTDKKFKSQITQKLSKVLCDWKVFTTSRIVRKLNSLNITVFPIDLKKVPFSLQE